MPRPSLCARDRLRLFSLATVLAVGVGPAGWAQTDAEVPQDGAEAPQIRTLVPVETRPVEADTAEVVRADEEDAARIAAEEEAARLAAEEEAARRAAEEEAARIAAEEDAARIAAEEEAARIAAEEEAARIAAAEAARIEAAVDACIGTAGPPSAETAVSEAAQRAALQALARAQSSCREAVDLAPEAGGALFHLATIAQVTGEHRQAVQLYERAAEAGVPAAHTRLGDYYNFGIRPIREDIDTAVAQYQRAAELGDPAGATTLALMHQLGRGVPRDAARMLSLLQFAAEQDYAFAQSRLAEVYLTGAGVPGGADAGLGLPDPRRAIPLLASVARAGDPEAALQLAAIYDTGVAGVAPNPARRFRWINFLAETGDPAAIALRAFLQEQGIGTVADPEAAAQGYVAALETGEVDPEAMRGTVNGRIPAWERETALAFQRILQERGLYTGPLDAIIGGGTLRGARALADR